MLIYVVHPLINPRITPTENNLWHLLLPKILADSAAEVARNTIYYSTRIRFVTRIPVDRFITLCSVFSAMLTNANVWLCNANTLCKVAPRPTICVL